MLNYRLFGLLIVVVIITGDSDGILYQSRARGTKSRSRRSSTCRFDKRNIPVGHTWHPHLQPNGVNYCITCKCQKSGYVHCERVKCKNLSCPEKVVLPKKCCPVCKGSLNSTASQKQCLYKGKSYSSSQVWNVAMKSQDGNKNNCAECTCHNGVVSCAIRLCPVLICALQFQTKDKHSCCRKCAGLPLKAVGDVPTPDDIKLLKGTCYNKGRYYKTKSLWNPLTPTSEVTAFQHPNCQLCSCQNGNVACNKVPCPKLDCKNPIKRNPKDCCQSCPGKDSHSNTSVSLPRPFTSRPNPITAKDVNYPNCMFLQKIYQHNSTWSTKISLQNNYCVRCTCTLSQVKCKPITCQKRIGCGSHCSSPKVPKTLKTKPSGKRDCSGVRVHVYLQLNGHSRKARRRQATQHSYSIKIAIISTKNTFVRFHHWNVEDKKATLTNTKMSNARFARRRNNFTKLGETKYGRINRFLNKGKTLSKCNLNCKNKAKELVKMLRTRVKYLKKSCRATQSFRHLLKPPS